MYMIFQLSNFYSSWSYYLNTVCDALWPFVLCTYVNVDIVTVLYMVYSQDKCLCFFCYEVFTYTVNRHLSWVRNNRCQGLCCNWLNDKGKISKSGVIFCEMYSRCNMKTSLINKKSSLSAVKICFFRVK